MVPDKIGVSKRVRSEEGSLEARQSGFEKGLPVLMSRSKILPE